MSIPALGQFSIKDFLSKDIVKALSKKVVQDAEPPARNLVHQERSRVARALIGGIPFASGAAIAFVGTRYLVPDHLPILKAAGYSLSAAAIGIGAWKSLSALKTVEEAPPVKEASSLPSSVTEAIDQAARSIAQEADPKIRTIIKDERARLSGALTAGVPWAAGGGATALLTFFLLEGKYIKVLGYTTSIALFTVASWQILDRMKT